MRLEDFAKPICSGDEFVKASFGGMSGAGKTTTAVNFAIGVYKFFKYTKPILIIDNESGSRFLIKKFKAEGINVLLKNTTKLADVVESFNFLNSKEISILFIDSLSKIYYDFTSDYLTKNKRVFMTMQDYGKLFPIWNELFCSKMVAAKGSCLYTGRGGFVYDMEVNEDTHKKEFFKSGVKTKLPGETAYESDLNIWMQRKEELDENDTPRIWREAIILKDRSSLLDGKVLKNPTFEDFKPFVEYVAQLPKGEIVMETCKENIVPIETYDNMREAKKIKIEEINNTLSFYYPGQSKEEKTAKLALLKYAFGTYSESQINLLNISILDSGYVTIKDILSCNAREEKVKEIISNLISNNDKKN